MMAKHDSQECMCIPVWRPSYCLYGDRDTETMASRHTVGDSWRRTKTPTFVGLHTLIVFM